MRWVVSIFEERKLVTVEFKSWKRGKGEHRMIRKL